MQITGEGRGTWSVLKTRGLVFLLLVNFWTRERVVGLPHTSEDLLIWEFNRNVRWISIQPQRLCQEQEPRSKEARKGPFFQVSHPHSLQLKSKGALFLLVLLLRQVLFPYPLQGQPALYHPPGPPSVILAHCLTNIPIMM